MLCYKAVPPVLLFYYSNPPSPVQGFAFTFDVNNVNITYRLRPPKKGKTSPPKDQLDVVTRILEDNFVRGFGIGSKLKVARIERVYQPICEMSYVIFRESQRGKNSYGVPSLITGDFNVVSNMITKSVVNEVYSRRAKSDSNYLMHQVQVNIIKSKEELSALLG